MYTVLDWHLAGDCCHTKCLKFLFHEAVIHFENIMASFLQGSQSIKVSIFSFLVQLDLSNMFREERNILISPDRFSLCLKELRSMVVVKCWPLEWLHQGH